MPSTYSQEFSAFQITQLNLIKNPFSISEKGYFISFISTAPYLDARLLLKHFSLFECLNLV